MRYTPYVSSVLRQLIEEVLSPIGLYSPNACELLLATAAQESLFGTFRTQGNGGPARGIFQMEGEDHDDIWQNYLAYHSNLANYARTLSAVCTVDDLVMNDKYAVFMARVHYLRAPGSIPDATSLTGLWNYYKAHYNTAGGAATENQFFMHYKAYVTDGVAA